MAIVYEGTRVDLSNPYIPDGYVKTPITGFSDQDWETPITKTFNVPKTPIENADPVVTFTALVAAIDTEVGLLLANDYIGTNTVDSFGVFTAITNNSCDLNTDYYTSAATVYTCTVQVFVKVS